jgi:hypothetical protein
MAKITPIPNHEAYSVSTDGIVYKGGKQLNTYSDKRGYEAVYLYDGHNNRKYMSVHRIVMLAHSPIDNPSEMTVNHKGGNKNNNDISNLEWTTNLENMRHAYKNGFFANRKNRSGFSGDMDALGEAFSHRAKYGTSFRKLQELFGINRATLQYQYKLTYERNIT